MQLMTCINCEKLIDMDGFPWEQHINGQKITCPNCGKNMLEEAE